MSKILTENICSKNSQEILLNRKFANNFQMTHVNQPFTLNFIILKICSKKLNFVHPFNFPHFLILLNICFIIKLGNITFFKLYELKIWLNSEIKFKSFLSFSTKYIFFNSLRFPENIHCKQFINFRYIFSTIKIEIKNSKNGKKIKRFRKTLKTQQN